MSLEFESAVDLAKFTTLKVGGPASYIARVKSKAELREALLFANNKKLPVLVIGGGSNLLVSDEGFAGLVIKNELKGLIYQESEEEVTLACGAGEELDEVVSDTVAKNYWGLENLTSIPGTVGATPIQNVGAYGVEVADMITAVEAINIKTGAEKTFTNEDCQFDYRDSFFKTVEGRDWVVTEVTFKLSKNANPKIQYADLNNLLNEKNLTLKKIRETIKNIRAGKFPDWEKVGTAGSFFKNPIISQAHYLDLKNTYPDLPGYDLPTGEVKVSLGWILDKACNLKGFCESGVCLYEKQALVLINQNANSTTDIKNFVDKIKKIVEEKTKIKIEEEVRNI